MLYFGLCGFERYHTFAATHPLARQATESNMMLVESPEQIVLELYFDVVEEHVAAPVFLESEIALALAVEVREEVVLLGPQGVGRVKVLEILNQPSAVEAPCTEIAGQRG
jgi:hypothetical protein